LVLQFSKTAKKLTFELRLTWEKTLENSFRMVAAYKRGRDLRDILVHSRLGPTNNRILEKTQDILVRGRQRGVYRIARNIPLNRKNCVYLIKCSLCRKRYTVQTKNSILTRMWAYRYTIRKGTGRKGHIVPHFGSHDLQNLKIFGLG